MNKTKKCTKCEIIKPVTDFHINKSSKHGFQPTCKICQSEYRKRRYLLNKEYEDNRNKNYALENRQKMLDNSRDWFQKNKEKVILDRKIKRNSDPIIKFKHNVRSLISSSFRYCLGVKKNSKTEKILGCSLDLFKKHIEKQFTKGMSWEKMGSLIHLDHLDPLSNARTEEDVIRLSHYKNIRPLWAKDNFKKGNKIVEHQIHLPL